MSYLLIFLAAIGLAIGTPDSSKAATNQPKAGGTFTLATEHDIRTMNPLVNTSSNDKWVRQLMFEPLLESDETGRIHPYLAESWKASSDGKTYTFELRNGVRFHNGQEMTAEDVKFSMDYTLNPKNGAYGRSRLEYVDRVEATGKHTLKIYLKNRTPLFIPALASIQTFSVIPKGSLPENIQKPATFPPGTGPFKFVEWKAGQQLVVVRHEEYWGAKPFLDRVTLRPIPDSTVRFVALRSGDIDLGIRVPLEWVSQLKKGEIQGVNYVEIANSGLFRMQFNVTRPPLNNKKLRQAIVHAVDKKELIDATFSGFGEPIIQKYPKGHVWYFDDIPSLSHDPKKAMALLREAGYKGEMIEITGGNAGVVPTMASVLHAQFKRVGINVKIRLLEAGASRQAGRTGDFGIGIGAAGKYLDPSDTYGRDFGCESDPTRRINNESGYCDPEMEALLEKAATEMNPQTRREIFKRILTKLNEDVPTIYLAFVPRFFAFRDHVKGFTSIDDGTYRWFGGGLTHTWLEK